MSLEENKAVVRRHYEEGWNQKNLSTVDETHSPDHIHYDPSNPTTITGAEGIKKRLAQVIQAFPDLHFNIEDMIAEGEKVVVYWTLSGTQEGEFAGIPPTGKRIEGIQGMIIHRLSNGMIVEDKTVRDTMSMMQQLGVIPPRGKR